METTAKAVIKQIIHYLRNLNLWISFVFSHMYVYLSLINEMKQNKDFNIV